MKHRRFSESRSETFRALWQDPAFRLKRSQGLEKVRDQIGESISKKWKNDKKFYKRMCKIRKEQANKEENLIRNSNALKRFWADPKNKAKMIEARKKSYAYTHRYSKSCFKKGRIPWNKGLTKKTHKSLQAVSEKLRGIIPDYNKYRCNYIPLDGKPLIRMRSSWEVVFAHWLDKHGIEWMYEPKHFYIGEGRWTGTTYTPDFYIPRSKIYVEVKGHFSKEFGRKLVEFHKRYPNRRIVILSGRAKFAEMMDEVFNG